MFLLIGSAAQAEVLSYQRDIQPIFTAKCVACHACYDSPCQLNLGSGEGAERGANKLPVYNGVRSRPRPRLACFDAEGEQAWRRKGFHSVLDAQGGQAALMARMLDLGRSQPLTPNAKLPAELNIGIDRANNCPLPDEFDGYARKEPARRHAFRRDRPERSGIRHRATLAGAGRRGRASTAAAPAREATQIEQWERLLNTPPRGSPVARWLYEHLFIAHLYFEGVNPVASISWCVRVRPAASRSMRRHATAE